MVPVIEVLLRILEYRFLLQYLHEGGSQVEHQTSLLVEVKVDSAIVVDSFAWSRRNPLLFRRSRR
jgi:hypothetical protein